MVVVKERKWPNFLGRSALGRGSASKGVCLTEVCIQGCLPLGFCLWGVCIQGIYLQGSLHSGMLGRPPKPETRAVRILLECFLVCCRYLYTLHQGCLMITLSITYSLFNTNSRNKIAISDNYGVNFLYYFQWLSEHRKHTRLFSCSECDISRSFSMFEKFLLLDLFLCLLLTVIVHVKT